ncbi:MAG: zinc ribbon domain-containing protein [Candidatus Hodarchaeales archaeon]
MKYNYLVLIAVVLFTLSLIVSFVLNFPLFIFFLPFPPIMLGRKKTTDLSRTWEIRETNYCGYCGKTREEDWIACPYCGYRFE